MAWPRCSRRTPWRGGCGFASTRKEESRVLSKLTSSSVARGLQQKWRHGGWVGPWGLLTSPAPHTACSPPTGGVTHCPAGPQSGRRRQQRWVERTTAGAPSDLPHPGLVPWRPLAGQSGRARKSAQPRCPCWAWWWGGRCGSKTSRPRPPFCSAPHAPHNLANHFWPWMGEGRDSGFPDAFRVGCDFRLQRL